MLSFLSFASHTSFYANLFLCILLMQVIKDNMTMTYHMEGSVNGHFFTIEGEDGEHGEGSKGNPYE